MNKRLIIIGLILSLVVVPLVVVAVASLLSPQTETLTNDPPQRSDSELIQAIAMSSSSLHDAKNTPTFTLIAQKRIASNWYVAWIDDKTVKVLLNDPAESAKMIRVVLGPGSEFDKSDALSRGVPDTVYEEFIHETR